MLPVLGSRDSLVTWSSCTEVLSVLLDEVDSFAIKQKKQQQKDFVVDDDDIDWLTD